MIMVMVLIVAMLIFIISGIIAAKIEEKNFNNGVCSNCNSKLINFDRDSQGGRGYTCKKCDYTTWVSYNRVDKNYNN